MEGVSPTLLVDRRMGRSVGEGFRAWERSGT
jgi:hypothetical protein